MILIAQEKNVAMMDAEDFVELVMLENFVLMEFVWMSVCQTAQEKNVAMTAAENYAEFVMKDIIAVMENV